MLLLEPLLDCEEETIREGVRAMLALRYTEALERTQQRELEGWTAYQISDDTMLEGLRAASQRWTEYEQPQVRDSALERFHDYADQWYD